MNDNRTAEVVVTFNRLPLLQKCIEKLEAQTVPCDILVVNNSGTDGTAAWLAEREAKNVHKCVELMKSSDVCRTAGITDDRIVELMKQYDYIVPLRSELEKINIHSAYEDYIKVIPGVHVTDIFILKDVFGKVYPTQVEKLREYLYSPNKLMYQFFITKPQQFNDYCEWLFDLLFQTDPLIDVSRYSVNGRRTMGYLAELLFGFYFTNMVPQEKTLHTGVTWLI